MTRARSVRSLAPLLLALAPALTHAQAPQEEAYDDDGFPLVSASELVLERYSVQHVESEALLDIARRLVGRAYRVRENPVSEPMLSLRQLGDVIVLYDTKREVERARALLTSLDVPREPWRESLDGAPVEYRPRFVSLKTVERTLVDLVAQVNVVPERGLVVMVDSQPNIDAALELLGRIDVAERQVLITCQLVEVGGSTQGVPLPKDLADNLQKLLPQSTFTQIGMAMLKTSAGSQDAVSVQIETPDARYGVSFTPIAFDVATGALTISGCRLVEDTGEEEPRQLFQTHTILRGGEYTVLGATGATPRVLVVRVTPQG